MVFPTQTYKNAHPLFRVDERSLPRGAEVRFLCFLRRLVLACSLRMYTLRTTDDLLTKERYLVVKGPFTSAALLASGRSL